MGNQEFRLSAFFRPAAFRSFRRTGMAMLLKTAWVVDVPISIPTLSIFSIATNCAAFRKNFQKINKGLNRHACMSV